MTDERTRLAERLRKAGEQELERWAAQPHGVARLLGNLMLMMGYPLLLIFYGGDWQPWMVSVWFGLWFGITLLHQIDMKKSTADANRHLARWRPKLEAHFRQILIERGLLAAINTEDLGPEWLVSLTPDGSPWWDRPLQARWIKADTRTLKGRVNGLLKYYVRCCKVLALEPFPQGFTYLPPIYPLSGWFSDGMWQAALRIVLADALSPNLEPELVDASAAAKDNG